MKNKDNKNNNNKNNNKNNNTDNNTFYFDANSIISFIIEIAELYEIKVFWGDFKNNVEKIDETLEFLKTFIKYDKFDIEATKRENEYLKKLLEKSGKRNEGNESDEDNENNEENSDSSMI